MHWIDLGRDITWTNSQSNTWIMDGQTWIEKHFDFLWWNTRVWPWLFSNLIFCITVYMLCVNREQWKKAVNVTETHHAVGGFAPTSAWEHCIYLAVVTFRHDALDRSYFICFICSEVCSHSELQYVSREQLEWSPAVCSPQTQTHTLTHTHTHQHTIIKVTFMRIWANMLAL